MDIKECFDFIEIEHWLQENADTLAREFGVSPPTSIAVEPSKHLYDHYRWGFHIWTMPCESEEFIRVVMPELGFTVHWTFNQQTNHGVDSYLSMYKIDWPVMEIREKICQS